MKPFIQVLALGLACCLGSAAHAAVVTYTYQATISSITERQNSNAGFVPVTQNGLAGTPVAIGDIVAGSFQYDTSSALGGWQPAQLPGSTSRMYDSGANDYISYVDKTTGLTFLSMPSLNWLGSNQVTDSVPIPGATSYDAFGMTRGAMDDDMTALATIRLYDQFGSAFQSAELPAQLSRAVFQFAALDGSFLRQSDGAYMSFTADITSLERADVPEPGSAFLFAIAASGLFGLRRKRGA